MSHALRCTLSARQPLCLTMAILFLLAGPMACREDNDEKPEDMSSSADMAMTPDDMSQPDMSARDMPLDQGEPPKDLGPDIPPSLDAPADLEEIDMAGPEDMRPTCEGDCATHDLTIAFGANTRALGRAVYGLSSPEQSSSGEGWEIYVEALQGGFSGCPEELSNAPEYTFIVSGLPIVTGGEELSNETHQLNAILFDYQGDLVPDPPFRTTATDVRITARTTSVCTDCVGMGSSMMGNSDPGGFVSLDIEATFPEGTVSGTLYAEHCNSLDAE